jgi:hypothetical protein
MQLRQDFWSIPVIRQCARNQPVKTRGQVRRVHLLRRVDIWVSGLQVHGKMRISRMDRAGPKVIGLIKYHNLQAYIRWGKRKASVQLGKVGRFAG